MAESGQSVGDCVSGARLAVYRDIPSVSIRGTVPVAQHWESRLAVLHRLRRFLQSAKDIQMMQEPILRRQETVFRKACMKALLSDQRYLSTVPHVIALFLHDPRDMVKAAFRRFRKNNRQPYTGTREQSNTAQTPLGPDKRIKLHLDVAKSIYLVTSTWISSESTLGSTAHES